MAGENVSKCLTEEIHYSLGSGATHLSRFVNMRIQCLD